MHPFRAPRTLTEARKRRRHVYGILAVGTFAVALACFNDEPTRTCHVTRTDDGILVPVDFAANESEDCASYIETP
jgi:hypothetical protein